jgi:GAF domain-containing protein
LTSGVASSTEDRRRLVELPRYDILDTEPELGFDLSTDRRTRDIQVVTGTPFARFYAGVPSTNPSCARLGTICVLDTKPRPQGLTLNQGLSLEALARQTITILELRHAMRKAATG